MRFLVTVLAACCFSSSYELELKLNDFLSENLNLLREISELPVRNRLDLKLISTSLLCRHFKAGNTQRIVSHSPSGMYDLIPAHL